VGGEQGPVEAAHRRGLQPPGRNELGAGLSYYFDDHTYEVQLDAFHLWEGMARFEGGEDRVRLSMQAFL